MAKHIVIDPANGDQVSLRELAVKHGISLSTVRRRHWLGLSGWDLVRVSRYWREWSSSELKFLDEHYPAGMLLCEISEHVGHSEDAVMSRALIRKLKRPRRCTDLAVKNYEELVGKPLYAAAIEYKRRNLSRMELATDIGIGHKSLKRLLPPDIWESWPHNTVGRQLACEQRRA